MLILWTILGLLAWAVIVGLLCSLFAINPREEWE